MKSDMSDLELAFDLVEIADKVTLKLWSPHDLASKTEVDDTGDHSRC